MVDLYASCFSPPDGMEDGFGEFDDGLLRELTNELGVAHNSDLDGLQRPPGPASRSQTQPIAITGGAGDLSGKCALLARALECAATPVPLSAPVLPYGLAGCGGTAGSGSQSGGLLQASLQRQLQRSNSTNGLPSAAMPAFGSLSMPSMMASMAAAAAGPAAASPANTTGSMGCSLSEELLESEPATKRSKGAQVGRVPSAATGAQCVLDAGGGMHTTAGG